MRVISRTPGWASRSRFGDHRLEAARAELAAQLRDDAEGAGMIAALGDLDVGRVTSAWPECAAWFRRRDSWAGRRWRRPSRLCEKRPAASRASPSERDCRMTNGRVTGSGAGAMPAAARMSCNSPVPTTASTSGMFFRISLRKRSTRQPATTSFLGPARGLVLRHLEDGVHRFLLGACR